MSLNPEDIMKISDRTERLSKLVDYYEHYLLDYMNKYNNISDINLLYIKMNLADSKMRYAESIKDDNTEHYKNLFIEAVTLYSNETKKFLSKKGKLTYEVLENIDSSEDVLPYFESSLVDNTQVKKKQKVAPNTDIKSKATPIREKQSEKPKTAPPKKTERVKEEAEPISVGYSSLPIDTVVTLLKEWQLHETKGTKYTEYTVSSFSNGFYSLKSSKNMLHNIAHKDIFILPMNDDQYYVDSIIDRKLDSKLKKYMCKVRWTGYGPESDSWIAEDDVDKSLVDDYKIAHKKK